MTVGPKFCIICGNEGTPIILNDLPMKKCRVCGLVWLENFDIQLSHYENLEDIDLSSDKIKRRINNCIDRANTIKKFLDLNNLCDIGCGDGLFLKVLQEQGFENLIGIEPNIHLVDFAKNNGLKIIRGSIEDAERVIRFNGIKIVTMFHVIEHLPDPLATLKSIYTSLDYDGKLVLETPDIESYSIKKTNYKNELIYPKHLFYFNQSNLEQLLEEVGFKIIFSGKRDFDQNHLSLSEIFFRLGIFSRHPKGGGTKGPSTNNSSYKNPISKTGGLRKLATKLARTILSRIVKITGRSDYIWMVVAK